MSIIYDLTVNSEELLPIDLVTLFKDEEIFADDSFVSIILHVDHIVDLFDWLDVKVFEYYKAETDSDYTDYMLVTAFMENGEIKFIVESVHNEEKLKTHECEVLILPSYLPQELKKHYTSNTSFRKLIRLVDDSISNLIIQIIKD